MINPAASSDSITPQLKGSSDPTQQDSVELNIIDFMVNSLNPDNAGDKHQYDLIRAAQADYQNGKITHDEFTKELSQFAVHLGLPTYQPDLDPSSATAGYCKALKAVIKIAIGGKKMPPEVGKHLIAKLEESITKLDNHTIQPEGAYDNITASMSILNGYAGGTVLDTSPFSS